MVNPATPADATLRAAGIPGTKGKRENSDPASYGDVKRQVRLAGEGLQSTWEANLHAFGREQEKAFAARTGELFKQALGEFGVQQDKKLDAFTQKIEASHTALGNRMTALETTVTAAQELLNRPLHKSLKKEWKKMGDKDKEEYVAYQHEVADHGQYGITVMAREIGRSPLGGVVETVGTGLAVVGGAKAVYEGVSWAISKISGG